MKNSIREETPSSRNLKSNDEDERESDEENRPNNPVLRSSSVGSSCTAASRDAASLRKNSSFVDEMNTGGEGKAEHVMGLEDHDDSSLQELIAVLKATGLQGSSQLLSLFRETTTATTRSSTETISNQAPAQKVIFAAVAHDLRFLHEQKLQQEQALQQQIADLQNHRSRLQRNVHTKKTHLTTAANMIQDLQTEQSRLWRENQALQTQVSSLKTGLQKVTAKREEYKQKVRVQQELEQLLKNNCHDLEKQVSLHDKQRDAERKILDLYRELANNTGFKAWGKRIRMAEAELADLNNKD